jgi:hypothetical protein
VSHANQELERVVGAYLSNSILPRELVWLRSEISLNNECRKLFLRKCRQHQRTQYFMVQQTLPTEWGEMDGDDISEESHILSEASVSGDIVLDNSPDSRLKNPEKWNLRDVLEYGFTTGLICLTILLLISWLDRHRLFQNTQVKPVEPSLESESFRPDYAVDAFHSVLINDHQTAIDTTEHSDGHYLSTHLLRWYLQMEDQEGEGWWSDEPTDYGIDFEKLEKLHRKGQLRAEEYPHSMLHPEFLINDVVLGTPKQGK